MRRVKVWVDDERMVPPGYDVSCPTAEIAIRFIDKHWGQIDVLSLDHDLGEESYGSGYDIIKWIEEKVYVSSWEPTMEIKIHTDNPVGRKNMLAALESIERRRYADDFFPQDKVVIEHPTI